jgi:F420-dependent oxidoreductase-like protein
MRVAIGIGVTTEDWDEATSYVQEAERLGVYSVWSAESWGHDAITPLAYLAGKTSRIMLGTGIMQAGTRTPALVAMTALSMQAISHGRFLIGIGASGPQVIEGWHGQEFGHTNTRIREIIAIVRKAVAGERLAFDGAIYTLPRPGGEGKALKTGARPQPVPPVYLATLSPKALEMTGEVADGWLGTSFIPEQAHVFFDHIRAGAERAGRSLADLDLQAGGAVAFGDDLEALIATRRPGVAFQLGAMGSRRHNFYNDAFKRAGYADVASEVQRLYLDGQRQQAAALLPEEMILTSNLLGTEAQVAERVRAYRNAGVTTLRAQPEGRTAAERLETLARLMRIVEQVNSESAAATSRT